MLADDEAEQFLATSTGHQTFATGNEPIIASSGDREFDYALAQTLSRITDTFRILPGFAYYDDFGVPNALATSVVRMARADGTVLFGQRYLKKLLAWPEHPDVAVTAFVRMSLAISFSINSISNRRSLQVKGPQRNWNCMPIIWLVTMRGR
jgi:hypothetical protein